MKTCEQCGESFEPGIRHPNQRFCPGGKCRAKWEATHCYNSVKSNCQYCGKAFVPKRADRNKYCSDCKGKFHRKTRGIEPVFVSVCVTCGKYCKTSYCSSECLKIGEAARARKIYAAIPKEVFAPRICKECCGQFVPEHGSQEFCNARCSRKHFRRIGKATRRAHKVSAGQIDSIDPIKVFERDGWRCHICKKHTPKRLRGTIEDMAPEMDHIIPLAQGGSHTWDNVACACRKCNGNKGSQIIGQQLLPVFAGIY